MRILKKQNVFLHIFFIIIIVALIIVLILSIREYQFVKISKDNLLIMSDSFAWSIDYLIASSFNNTHVINLRYDEFKNNSFNLTKYIKDNHITKVLFLYESGSTMFDQYNYNFTGRVY